MRVFPISPHRLRHQRLLDVEPVLGLVVDDDLGAFDDLVRTVPGETFLTFLGPCAHIEGTGERRREPIETTFRRFLLAPFRTDVPSQIDVGKERLAERNALRAQSSFEGALSATRVENTGLRSAWPTKREKVVPHNRFDSCWQVMEDERSGSDGDCAIVGGPGTQK